MCETREFYFDSSGGTKVYAREWLPEGNPRAVLQLTHGIMEHIGRYDSFARFLTEKGFAVVGNDLLGHGKTAATPEDLGYIADTDGWMTLADDMRTLYQMEHEKYPKLPYFMLGHSMGSFLVRTYLTLYKNELAGAILSGTAQPPAALNKLGALIAGAEIKKHTSRGRSKRLNDLFFGSYGKKFNPVRASLSWLSSDDAVVDAYMADPLCGFLPTAGMFSDMLFGIDYISNKRNLRRMQKNLPVYFFSGASDPVGAFGKGVRRAYQLFFRAGCQDISLKLYPEGRHEMLNEVMKAEVYSDVLDWLERKLPV